MILGNAAQDGEARLAGFLDAADQRAAKDAGVTDPAAWRAANEAKRRAELGRKADSLSDNAASPLIPPDHGSTQTNQDGNADQKMNGHLRTGGGWAKVCAAKEIEFNSYREIKLPPTTVFRDAGTLTGDVRDPWRPGRDMSDRRQAAFITT
jgi:hypothetical protein